MKQPERNSGSVPAMVPSGGRPLRLHRLSVVYFIALSFIALTIVASWGVMKYAIGRNVGDSRIINLAGRQRMLSQRLTKCALLLAVTDSPAEWQARRAELALSLSEWEQAHHGLQFGDAKLGLPSRENSPEIRRLFAEIEPHHAAMVAALRELLRMTEQTGEPASSLVWPAVGVLKDNEPGFLKVMDAITFQFDGEAHDRIRLMNWLELAIMCCGLGVLMLEFLVVFRPSLRQLTVLFAALQARTADLEQSNAALVQSERAATVANATKEEFISIIAHDLRGPIGTMEGYLEALLQPGVTAADRQEGVRVLLTSASRLRRLTEHLLAWARLQRRQMTVSPRQFDLMAVAAEQAELLKDTAAAKKQTVTLAGGNPLPVLADREMTATIVRNLLGNAIKYTPPGGSITVCGERAANDVRLAVCDTGTGMTAEQQERLFNIADYRSAPGTAGEKGTGLGLILSRDFARRNGGMLTVASRAGEGTTMTLTLPAAG